MTTDLTKTVMEKVVRFEKRRIAWWVIWFGVTIGILLIIVLVVFGVAAQRINERGTLNLLTLFTEDWEIVAEFWQDSLATFIAELPIGKLLLGAGAGIAIVIVWVLTGTRRQIVRRKVQDLRK